METWSIHLHKEYFKFSCAHFLIFPDGSRERLHGHNYQVEVEIQGALSDRGLVIEFNEVKPLIRELCDGLDEHWIVPVDHPELEVSEQPDGHTLVVYRGERYLAPSGDVLALPINNTSAENIATWFGRELGRRLREHFGPATVRRLRVSISETSGQRGVFESLADA